MPQDETRKTEAFQARSPSGEAGGFASSPRYDPGTEPTVSSAHLDSAYSRTRIDPDAPIHHGATASQNHVALPVGYALHEYTIEAVLGCGGFGITYLARDNNLQCQVAIKEYLPNDLAVRTEGQTVCARTESDTHGYRVGLDRFLAESRVLASFRHPNIVRVMRFFEANNTAYMVMDYEKGEPLREWIRQRVTVDEAQLLKMILPLLDGLEVVHRAGVLHRDIKPANIYVREEDGSLVLLDFGAARYASTGDSRSLTSIVTPGYAPFEQYHTHGAQGPWSDLYAFGGVLYWLVTGDKPLEAPSRVRSDTMPRASERAKGRYSERLLGAIDWALTPDEADRPMSVSQFRAVLTGEVAAPPPHLSKAAVAGTPRQAEAAKPSASVKMPLVLGGAGLALLLIAAIVFYPRGDRPPSQKTEPAAAAPTVAEKNGPAGKEAPKAAPPRKPSASARKAAEKDAVAAKPASAGQEAAPAPAAEKPKQKEHAAAVPTATVILDVMPQGEIILDGKKAGMSPPLTRLTVSAGAKHRVEIHSLGVAPPHYWTVELQPGETKEIRVNF